MLLKGIEIYILHLLVNLFLILKFSLNSFDFFFLI